MEIKFMQIALKEAEKAKNAQEVPVGACIVCGGKVIARAYNKKVQKNCSNYHAEIIAIEKACKKLCDWHLNECDIYVTLEPCPMCAGALINARIGNIYFGAYDDKSGCCGSLYNLPQDKRFNHRANVQGGILKEECANILTNFFKAKRENARAYNDVNTNGNGE
ncbi:MAG: tRNA adenosine(34) deaminase TadA [Clostridia bacterium]